QPKNDGGHMRSGRLLLAISFLCTCTALALADQVILQNGDRLSGTIVKSDDKSLSMKTEFAGDVTIDWSAVQQITSAAPLHINLNDGRTLAGSVTTENGMLEVSTS